MTGELLTKEQRVQSVCLGLFSLALDWWSLGVFAAGKKILCQAEKEWTSLILIKRLYMS